jgi:hypothetical protein
MTQLTQATSEEDRSHVSRSRIITAEQAFRAAVAVANPPDHEWMVGLCLDQTLRLIDAHQVFSSPTCRPCSDESLDALLTASATCNPDEIIIVRKHIHPWGGPRTPGMRRFRAFRRRAHERHVQIRDAFVADSTGEIYSIFGEPLATARMKFSPHIVRLVGLCGLVSPWID